MINEGRDGVALLASVEVIVAADVIGVYGDELGEGWTDGHELNPVDFNVVGLEVKRVWGGGDLEEGRGSQELAKGVDLLGGGVGDQALLRGIAEADASVVGLVVDDQDAFLGQLGVSVPEELGQAIHIVGLLFGDEYEFLAELEWGERVRHGHDVEELKAILVVEWSELPPNAFNRLSGKGLGAFCKDDGDVKAVVEG